MTMDREKRAAYLREWREKNKDKTKEYDKKQRQKDKNKIKEKSRIAYLKSKETETEQDRLKRKEYKKSYYLENKARLSEKSKVNHQLNKDRDNERVRQWCAENREYKKQQDKIYYEENKDVIIARCAEYSKNNENYPVYRREYFKKRTAYDIQFRLQSKLRQGIYHAVKNSFLKNEYALAVTYLGCSIPDFKLYIESQFQQGMNWDNWGRKPNEWQFDHNKPLSAFDLTNPDHLLEVCHYSNIRPIWVTDNQRKGNKLPIGTVAKRQHIRKPRELFKYAEIQ